MVERRTRSREYRIHASAFNFPHQLYPPSFVNRRCCRQTALWNIIIKRRDRQMITSKKFNSGRLSNDDATISLRPAGLLSKYLQSPKFDTATSTNTAHYPSVRVLREENSGLYIGHRRTRSSPSVSVRFLCGDFSEEERILKRQSIILPTPQYDLVYSEDGSVPCLGSIVPTGLPGESFNHTGEHDSTLNADINGQRIQDPPQPDMSSVNSSLETPRIPSRRGMIGSSSTGVKDGNTIKRDNKLSPRSSEGLRRHSLTTTLQATQFSLLRWYSPQTATQSFHKNRRFSEASAAFMSGYSSGGNSSDSDAQPYLELARELVKLDLFMHTSAEFLAVLSENFVPKNFRRGDQIVRYGEVGVTMFFLYQGSVDVISGDRETNYTKLSDGAIFGEIALLFSVPRTASIIAAEKCICFVLHKDKLCDILKEYPEEAKCIREVAKQRYDLYTSENIISDKLAHVNHRNSAQTTGSLDITGSLSRSIPGSPSNLVSFEDVVNVGPSINKKLEEDIHCSDTSRSYGSQYAPTLSETNVSQELQELQKHHTNELLEQQITEIPPERIPSPELQRSKKTADSPLHDIPDSRVKEKRATHGEKQNCTSRASRSTYKLTRLSSVPVMGDSTLSPSRENDALYRKHYANNAVDVGVLRSDSTPNDISHSRHSSGSSGAGLNLGSLSIDVTVGDGDALGRRRSPSRSSMSSRTGSREQLYKRSSSEIHLKCLPSAESIGSKHNMDVNSGSDSDGVDVEEFLSGSSTSLTFRSPLAKVRTCGFTGLEKDVTEGNVGESSGGVVLDLPTCEATTIDNRSMAQPESNKTGSRTENMAGGESENTSNRGEGDCDEMPESKSPVPSVCENGIEKSIDDILVLTSSNPSTSEYQVLHPQMESKHCSESGDDASLDADKTKSSAMAEQNFSHTVGTGNIESTHTKIGDCDCCGNDNDNPNSSIVFHKTPVDRIRSQAMRKRSPSIAVFSSDIQEQLKDMNFSGTSSGLSTSVLTNPVNVDILANNDPIMDRKFVMQVMSYLGVSERFKCMGVCRKWKEIILSKPVWHDTSFMDGNRFVTDDVLLTILGRYGEYVCNLNLKNCWAVSDDGLEIVASKCNLQSVSLFSCWEISSAGLQILGEKCESIQHINLNNCRKITDVGMMHLTNHCIGLRTIQLSYCKNLTDVTLNYILARCRRLQHLNLHRCSSISKEGMKMFQQHPAHQMLTLNLSDCFEIDDEALQWVMDGCRILEEITLSFCSQLTPSSMKTLSTCGAMKKMDLSSCGNAVNDEGVRNLVEGPLACTIVELNLRNCYGLTGDGLRILNEKCPLLEYVNITNIKKISMADILACTSIKKIEYVAPPSLANVSTPLNRRRIFQGDNQRVFQQEASASPTPLKSDTRPLFGPAI
eukprot:CFRG1297T1